MSTNKPERKTKKVFKPPPGWEETPGWKTVTVHTARCELCSDHVRDDNPMKKCNDCLLDVCFKCEKKEPTLLTNHECVLKGNAAEKDVAADDESDDGLAVDDGTHGDDVAGAQSTTSGATAGGASGGTGTAGGGDARGKRALNPSASNLCALASKRAKTSKVPSVPDLVSYPLARFQKPNLPADMKLVIPPGTTCTTEGNDTAKAIIQQYLHRDFNNLVDRLTAVLDPTSNPERFVPGITAPADRNSIWEYNYDTDQMQRVFVADDNGRYPGLTVDGRPWYGGPPTKRGGNPNLTLFQQTSWVPPPGAYTSAHGVQPGGPQGAAPPQYGPVGGHGPAGHHGHGHGPGGHGHGHGQHQHHNPHGSHHGQHPTFHMPGTMPSNAAMYAYGINSNTMGGHHAGTPPMTYNLPTLGPAFGSQQGGGSTGGGNVGRHGRHRSHSSPQRDERGF